MCFLRLVICDLHFSLHNALIPSISPYPAIDTVYSISFSSPFIFSLRTYAKYITVILSRNSYLEEIFRKLAKFASVTLVAGEIHGSISRSNVLAGFSDVVFMRGTRYPFPLDAHTHTYVHTLDRREETARPLSLLIKPNRNRKAESKLHNYTGLHGSLTPTCTALTPHPRSLFPLFFLRSSFLFNDPFSST